MAYDVCPQLRRNPWFVGRAREFWSGARGFAASTVRSGPLERVSTKMAAVAAIRSEVMHHGQSGAGLLGVVASCQAEQKQTSGRGQGRAVGQQWTKSTPRVGSRLTLPRASQERGTAVREGWDGRHSRSGTLDDKQKYPKYAYGVEVAVQSSRRAMLVCGAGGIDPVRMVFWAGELWALRRARCASPDEAIFFRRPKRLSPIDDRIGVMLYPS